MQKRYSGLLDNIAARAALKIRRSLTRAIEANLTVLSLRAR
jgi:hypothetical protein